MSQQETTVFLLGAGVVAGSWAPVIAALRRTGFPDLATLEAGNFAMARLVYRTRLAVLSPGTPFGQRAGELTAELDSVRRAIAEELGAAEDRGALKLSSEFHHVVQHFILANSRVAFVTTNWDGVVAAAFQDIRVLHVHGSVRDHQGLYLLTEVAEEPYRDPETLKRLKHDRAVLMDLVGAATRLVFYGLGMSALDAELGQVVATGLHESSVREIFVVDPHYKEVAERIATLDRAGFAEMPIRGSKPADLASQWLFSAAELR